MAAKPNMPVIIKRKKIVVEGGGHHGGAWKVAYADFVTAMMAFFMLMWLLNATTESQRSGIADYFSPEIPMSKTSGGGNGALGGDSVLSEETMARVGMGASSRSPTANNRARGETGVDESEEAGKDTADLSALSELERKLVGSGGESMVSDGLLRHVLTRQTDEGLIVELFDLPDAPLFAPGGATPRPVMEQILGELAPVFNLVTNDIAVKGHVAARPVVETRESPWALSTSRADETRLRLGAAGLETDRVERVEGHSDRRPAARNPLSARNNRIEIVLLRREP